MITRAEIEAQAKEDGIRSRQRTLCALRVARPDLSTREAAEIVGISVARAYATLRKPKCRAYMDALRALSAEPTEQPGTVMSVVSGNVPVAGPHEILSKITMFLRSDISEWIEFDEKKHQEENILRAADDQDQLDPDNRIKEHFRIDLRRAFEKGLGPQLEELSFDKFGQPKLKFVNKLQAAQVLARLIGLDRATPDEPEEARQAREMFRQVLQDPKAREALDRIAISYEQISQRVTITR